MHGFIMGLCCLCSRWDSLLWFQKYGLAYVLQIFLCYHPFIRYASPNHRKLSEQAEEEMVERFCHIQNHSPLTAYYYQVVYVQSDEDYRVEVHYLYSIHGKVMGRVYGDETGIRTGM